MIGNKGKIYLAGHSGMVGSAIKRALERNGYENVITRPSKELDLTHQKATEGFFFQEKPEVVILAAAKVGGIQANIKDPAGFLMTNLMIQNNVIHAAHQVGVKKLVFLGSSCIYPKEASQPMKEEYLLTGPLEETNEGYAIAKIAGIKACQYYHNQYGDEFVSIMPPNLYGYQDNFDPESSHVLAALIRKLHEGKRKEAPRVEIWGSGNQRRELMFVDDLADAVIYVMNYYRDPEFINVGVGQDWSIKEIAETVKAIVGYSGELFYNREKPDGMSRKLLDSSKINQLGWQPQTSLEEGIRKTYQWYLENIEGEER